MKLSVIILITVAAIIIVDSRDCPSGWKLVEKEENVECWKLINISPKVETYQEANDECRKINGTYGVLHNSYERAMFHELATGTDKQICYTVVQEMDGSGNYLSIDQPPTPLYIQQLNSHNELTLRNSLVEMDKIFISFVAVPKQNHESITVVGGKPKFEPCEISLGNKKNKWRIRIVVEVENDTKMMIEVTDEKGDKSEQPVYSSINYPVGHCCIPWLIALQFFTNEVHISYSMSDLTPLDEKKILIPLKLIDTIFSKNAYILNVEHVRSETKMKGYMPKHAHNLTPNMIPKGNRSIFQRHLDVYKFGNISIDIPKIWLVPGVDLLIQQEIDTSNITTEPYFVSCLNFKRKGDSISLFCLDVAKDEVPHHMTYTGFEGDTSTLSEFDTTWKNEGFNDSSVVRFTTTIKKGEQHDIKVVQSFESEEKVVEKGIQVGMFDIFKLSSNVWYRNLIVTVTNEQLVTTCNYRSFDVSHYSNKLEVTHVHMPSLVLCQRSIDDFGHGEQGGREGTKKEKMIKQFKPPKGLINDVWAYRLLFGVVLPSSVFAISAVIMMIVGSFHK